MREGAAKKEVIQQLKRELLTMQGFRRKAEEAGLDTGLGVLEQAFPGEVFPLAAVHEFISYTPEDAAATNGFMAAIAGRLVRAKGPCFWISNRRSAFPPGLKMFGIDPGQIFFVDVPRPKELLWTIEEALKCASLGAVIGECKELSFIASRRLQLAVEHSHATGFLHRYRPVNELPVACTTRWKVQAAASVPADDLPGVGFPRWQVQLQKVRNGRPGNWELEWSSEGLHTVDTPGYWIPAVSQLKTG